MPTCKICGSTKTYVYSGVEVWFISKTVCHSCYTRAYRKGEPIKSSFVRKSSYLININDIMRETKIHDNCWLYNKLGEGGYARIVMNGKWILLHRWMYEYYYNEDIKDGFVIDHLCGIRNCINPIHLEEVTLQENTRRGIKRHWKKQTHCKRGHKLSEADFDNRGWRVCIMCRRLRRRFLVREQWNE